MQHRPVAFIGPMGSGKSQVAARLAQRIGWPCLDLDAEVEKLAGRSIAAIFASEGEARFRALESDGLRAALARGPAVIATGGGVVLSEHNRALLGDGATVVWLQADLPTRMERMRDERAQRPLLHGDDPAAVLEKLDAQRTPLYASLADIVVETSGLDVDEVTNRVMAMLQAREAAA